MKQKLFGGILGIALAVLLTVPAGAQLAPYSQDFESLDQSDGGVLFADGWLVFANVFHGTEGWYLYGYGPFPAPNHGFGFSGIVTGEGGAEQGDQQLNIYSDYNNGDHGNGHWIESNVFQEQFIGAGDVGSKWDFSFDAKPGNINDCPVEEPCSSTAIAFIKTLHPTQFWLSSFIVLDTTDLPDTWGRYTLSIDITPDLVGHIFQIGFANTATYYQPSAVFYDNINFEEDPCSQNATVMVNDCDSGVPNLDLDACTMQDAVSACWASATNHGQFVSCTAHLVNEWAGDGLISFPDKGSIISCAARANRRAVYFGFSGMAPVAADHNGVTPQLWNGTPATGSDSPRDRRSPRGRK